MRAFERASAFVLAVAAVTISVGAVTTSPVICTTDTWTVNHENQTPCQVAAALEGACFNNVWNIDPLPPNQKYSGPIGGQTNPCQCNTVAFSLVSACGACQGAGLSTWAEWTVNCSASDITIGGYPRTIPQQANVPAWAYIDVTAHGGVWDPDAARAIANSNAAETTGGTPPRTGSPTSTASSTSTVSTSSSPSSSSSSSSSNAGAIAGGVVGGVAGLALLALLAFFLLRRRRRRAAAPLGAGGEKLDLAAGVTSPAPAYGDGHLPMQQPPPRLYDPSDPSTFPTTPLPVPYSPGPPGYGAPTPPPHGPYSPHSPHSPYTPPTPHTPHTPGGYSGAPEV